MGEPPLKGYTSDHLHRPRAVRRNIHLYIGIQRRFHSFCVAQAPLSRRAALYQIPYCLGNNSPWVIQRIRKRGGGIARIRATSPTTPRPKKTAGKAT